MNLLSSTKSHTLLESVIDSARTNYSTYVFADPSDNKSKLRSDIRKKILNDVKSIAYKIEVVDFFIKGSILTKNYTDKSDIDIFIQVNSDLPDSTIFRLLKPTWEKIDNTYLNGCPHPFQYYIATDEYNMKNTDAAYNVKTNKWMKRETTQEINIDDYLDKYQSYVEKFADFSEEIRRDVIDFDILLDISNDDAKMLGRRLKDKLKEIEIDINNYLELKEELKEFRTKAFAKEMTPSELKLYGSKTRTPGNVVFKFIERYHYLDLAKKLKEIIGDDGKLSKSEYKRLNKVLKKELTNEKTSFTDVFNSVTKGRVKGRGDMQHKAKHRQQSDTAGLLGQGTRKSANLLPDYQRKSPLKSDKRVATAKGTNKVLRVKQGSPEAYKLAKKYRITDPRGKKTVAGNQHNAGITIIFQ